jgi:hypothetical protein
VGKLIGKIDRGFCEIRVSFESYKGNDLVDIRQYMPIDGEMRPTRKGIAVPTKLLNEFCALVEKAAEELGDITV